MTSPMRPVADGVAPEGPGSGLVVLVDYDGTIASIDVTDELVRSADEAAWMELDLEYRSGAIGSRALLISEAALLPARSEELPAFVTNPPHDPTFVPFVRFTREHGVAVEVVSDGLGFFVEPALSRSGLTDLPVYAAELDFGRDFPEVTFPHGHATCRTCGTCKRQPVLRHQRAGRHVVFVGDGHSDRYAASYADTVFAKGDLAALCAADGIPFLDWHSFDDVASWLSRILAGGQAPPPMSRPFICGPEAEGSSHS